MARYIIVSSANSLILLWNDSGMSFMYIKNRHGPSTEPWSTPDKTGHESDLSHSRTALWVLDERKESSQVTVC